MNWTFYLPCALWLATVVGWGISRRRLIRERDEAILRAYSHMPATRSDWQWRSLTEAEVAALNEQFLAENPPTSRRYITDGEAT